MTPSRLLTPCAVLVVLIVATMPLAQTPKTGGAAKDNGDIALVEQLLIARRDYQRTLELLRAHYINGGDAEKAKWAEDELREYHRINHQAYRLDLDVTPWVYSRNFFTVFRLTGRHYFDIGKDGRSVVATRAIGQPPP